MGAFDPATATADEFYAHLRQRGTTYVPADRASVVATLRRRAKADNLVVVTSREKYRRGFVSQAQMRNRPTRVDLTADGMTIAAPDAEEDA